MNCTAVMNSPTKFSVFPYEEWCSRGANSFPSTDLGARWLTASSCASA